MRSIHNSEELHQVLSEFWDAYNAGASGKPGRTQLATSVFPDPVPVGPRVQVRLTVVDVEDSPSYGLRIYGVLADEEPRSTIDQLLRRRVWAGRGIIASFASSDGYPEQPEKIVARLAALNPGDVLLLNGFLATDGYLFHSDGRIHWEASGRSFGNKEIYTAGFWWLLKECLFA